MFNYNQYGNAEYSYPVDMWGLGCVLYELCMKEKFVEGIRYKERGRERERMVKKQDISNDVSVRNALLNGTYPRVTVNTPTSSL